MKHFDPYIQTVFIILELCKRLWVFSLIVYILVKSVSALTCWVSVLWKPLACSSFLKLFLENVESAARNVIYRFSQAGNNNIQIIH